jgi:hypothetical protein
VPARAGKGDQLAPGCFGIPRDRPATGARHSPPPPAPEEPLRRDLAGRARPSAAEPLKFPAAPAASFLGVST